MRKAFAAVGLMVCSALACAALVPTIQLEEPGATLAAPARQPAPRVELLAALPPAARVAELHTGASASEDMPQAAAAPAPDAARTGIFVLLGAGLGMVLLSLYPFVRRLAGRQPGATRKR